MRTMLAVTLAALAVQGCKSQKVKEVEVELAAAKARVATLEKRRQEVTAESRRLQVERKTFSQQADEAALARERLNAAGLVLQGSPIPDGVQLDEALRAKSPKLGALAAAIVQRQLPCIDPDADTEEERDGPDCSPPPVDDACEGVSQRTTQSFVWDCKDIVATGKAPATAVCVSSAELDESFYPLSAPTAHLQGDVVRLAFEKGGRLMVADWPPPNLELYSPSNWSELATCEEENGHIQCVRACDVRHGRLGGCDDWANEGSSGRGLDPETESYELQLAREAAARTAQEAAEARDELSYQECLAACSSGGEGAPEAEPSNAVVYLEYKCSPAPGLFQFDVELAEDDGGVPDHTLLLSFPELHAALAGADAPDDEDTVHELTTALDVEKLIEGKVVDGMKVYAGIGLNGTPMAVRVSMDGKLAPTELGLDEVCEFGEQVKSSKLLGRCVVAKAAREEANAKANAKAAKVDGGVDGGLSPDAGLVDAGVSP